MEAPDLSLAYDGGTQSKRKVWSSNLFETTIPTAMPTFATQARATDIATDTAHTLGIRNLTS